MLHWTNTIGCVIADCLFRLVRGGAIAVLLLLSVWSNNGLACIDNDEVTVRLNLLENASATVVDGLVRDAETALAFGRIQSSVRELKEAVVVARQLNDSRLEAMTLGALGNGLVMATNRASGTAVECLQQSLQIADERGFDDLEVLALFNLGNGFAHRRDRKALARYQQAAKYASTSGLLDLAARSWLNRAHFSSAVVDDPAAAKEDIMKAQDIVDGLQSTRQRAPLQLAIGMRWLDLALKQQDDNPSADAAGKALNEALRLAAANDLHRVEANALGHLGRLYQTAGRLDDAEALFERAETRARTERDPATGYVWSWELAHLYLTEGRRSEASNAYRRAIEMLRAIRSSTALAPNKGPFGRSVLDDAQDVLAEYVDLEFGGDDVTSDEEELASIQKIVEQQRQVDVESYFRDDCVADLQARITEDVQLSPETDGLAFIYPIVLEQRLVILVSVAKSIKRYIVPIGRLALTEDVRTFRQALMARDASFLEPARSLYRHLIAPIETDWREPSAEGARIHTLVIVPDGPIRGLPFAALHDGERFLVQRYAIGIAPGLSLLQSPPLAAARSQALLGGLTEQAEGYTPLIAVDEELRLVSEIENADVILTGDDFTEEKLARSLSETPFSVVHLASHAEFGRSAEDTYIITKDGRVDLDRLEELFKPSAFRDEPVELLTLSACNTASGDGQELSALGLAGVAVKAGARSALGTLWPVADESSPLLMEAFYRGVRQNSLSKVAALQEAQQTLLGSENEFRHPFYWAPYLLIGNWE